MRMMRNSVATPTIIFATALALSASSAGAETWPQRTVHVIVPFAAGGDAPLRAFAEPLAKRWKQPIIIENRPGAEGMIGVAAFIGIHDDHTLLYYSAAAISTFPVTHQKLPYDPTRDVVPISSVVDGSVVITASESLKVNSLAELVTFARAQPGKLNYYPANGGSFSILLPGFVKSESLDMVQVSYRDTSLAVQDIATGRIHVMMSTLPFMLPLARAGKVRLIAVTNNNRAAIAPDIPTAVEAGYPQLAFEGLQGFFWPPRHTRRAAGPYCRRCPRGGDRSRRCRPTRRGRILCPRQYASPIRRRDRGATRQNGIDREIARHQADTMNAASGRGAIETADATLFSPRAGGVRPALATANRNWERQ